jgi:hypothetical protein
MKPTASRKAQAETDSGRSLLLSALRKLAKDDNELFRILIGLFVPIKPKTSVEKAIQQFDVALDDENFRKVTKLIIAKIREIWTQGDKQAEEEDDLSPEDSKYTSAIATIITDPRTPEYIGKTLCTIMSSILDGRECNIKPRSLADLGELIAIILEDNSLPHKVKEPFSVAATEVMNRLVTGDEMESAWFRKYFEAASKREAVKE